MKLGYYGSTNRLEIVEEGKSIFISHPTLPEEAKYKYGNLLCSSRAMLNALKGLIHHDDAVKPDYKVPKSLRYQIEAAIKLAEGY